jgi:CBS domain-containing protein
MTSVQEETYPALRHLRVIDAMHPGLVSCSLDSPLRTVARMMATHRVHAILVVSHREETLPGGARWGIVSDVDLLRVAKEADLDAVTAASVATTPVTTVSTTDGLAEAAQLMAEKDVSHVLVIERHYDRPIGVLSTLDVARALAGFPERHPASF